MLGPAGGDRGGPDSNRDAGTRLPAAGAAPDEVGAGFAGDGSATVTGVTTWLFLLLPLLRCDRCGARGILLNRASCPRCGAVHGWALIDPAVLAVLATAVWDEDQRMVRRQMARAQRDVMARALDSGALAGLTMQVTPTLGPTPVAVAQEAQRRALLGEQAALLGPNTFRLPRPVSPMEAAYRAYVAGRCQVFRR